MAYENKDNGELERAKAWLDMAQAKWRLQTMQHRSRYNPKTGEYRQLPTRIRRFLNGTPVGMKTAVLAILKESAPYRSPVFDCETDEGLLYNPTNTFIRKDGVEHATGGKDPTYTIIQDLLLAGEGRDAFMFGDESSCAQVGETEYRWDEPYVEDCPDGGQGVSWQVTDINRDRETDLFSYRIRKVQALTVHVAPHVESCGARQRTAVEVWDNAYGEPGAFVQDPVRGGSAPIELPEPCSQPDGTTVRIDVYRNPDCTYRLTVQTTEAVTDDGADGEGAQYSVYRDRYKSTVSEKVLNAFAPLPKSGVEYSGGTVTRYSSEHNEDGTWNNATETETEREVLRSSEGGRTTPRGTHVSWTDTNAASPATGLPAGTAYGSWKTTKTPGGLYTNEYDAFSRSTNARIGLSCGDTAFSHTHETQDTAASVPSGRHAPAARDGLVTTLTWDTDADGAVTLRERKEQEHTVERAVRRATAGLLGTTSSYASRSVTKAAADALLRSPAAGTSVEARLTAGNMYDVEVQTFSRSSGAVLGLDCSKTVFQHTHESSAAAATVGADAANAGDGRTYRVSYSVDPSTGAVTARLQDTEEIHVPESRRSVRTTARGTETRTVSANAPARPPDPTAPGVSREWELTPGGRYNVTTTSTEPAAGPSGTACSKDMFRHEDETTTVTDSPGAADAADTVDGSGTYRGRRRQLGDDGLWAVTDTVGQELAVPGQRREERVTRLGRVTRTTDMQVTSEGTPLGATLANVGKERVVETTRGGRRNVTVTTVAPLADVDTAESCEDTAFLHTHSTTSLKASKGSLAHMQAANGQYAEESWSLTDLGTWEKRRTDRTEHNPSLDVQQYRDAFGTRTTTEEFSNPSQNGSKGGREYRATARIASVESTMTNGKAYNVRTTVEIPSEIDSGWLNFTKSTDKGLTVHYDFIVFRNAMMSQVTAWIRVAEGKRYTGGAGSYANHPQISIAPNRFGLWDGTVAVTTTFTPKAWASGGSTRDDNWESPNITVKSVSFVPVSGGKLLKVVTEETHRRGGGVGQDRLKALLAGGVVKGSQFSFHPGGQAFSFDIITKATSKGVLMDMPQGSPVELWRA